MEFAVYSADRAKVLSLHKKNDSDIKEYVQILREWMKKQLHLPSDLLHDGFLEICLLKNKFSIEKAKRKIENYCSMKSMDKYKYLFEDSVLLRLPSQEIQFYLPTPVLTDECHRIIIAKILDEEKYDMKREYTNAIMLREIISRHDYNEGEIILADYSQCSPMIMSKFRANVLADAITLAVKGHSARVKEVHIIGKAAPTMLAIAKPFLPQFLVSRLHTYADAESVKNLLPAKCLPKEYGGELKSLHEIKVDILDEIFINHREELRKYLTTRSREDLRLGGSSLNDMQGTFKKLNID